MQPPNTYTGATLPRRQFMPNVLSVSMGKPARGQSVDILVSEKVTSAVVTGVLTEAGKPRIVVGRASADLRQILTITPA
jgi:hypothetical protein